MNDSQLKDYLEEKVSVYNCLAFIPNDPICIPHQFTIIQDIEIAGFIAATFAWGQRKTIISKSNELLALMDHTPYDFILNHKESDLKKMLSFKHRTFNATDTLYFISVLKAIYTDYLSMEEVFMRGMETNAPSTKRGLEEFHKYFFSFPDFPQRTKKHVATPARNSACKRINMFLRWMVRDDDSGVDFGIWKNISPSQLICPCDVHVERVARQLDLISSTKSNWQTAEALTNKLKQLDPIDPVKYDFALFGIGIMENKI